MPGDRLDLTNDPQAEARVSSNARPFLGVRFACCGVYTRIYRNLSQTAYEGRCPRCAKRVKVGIGSGGCNSRFFEVR